MDYQETVEYIFQALPMFQREGAAAYKDNLDNSHALDLYDGSPHTSYPTIHVGGTNGKGSVAHMLAAILQCAGYKVGLYTSPHLCDFRERIRVNGHPIAKEAVQEYVASHQDYFEEIQPSFFEMSTAMAFWYFQQQQVDVAVIEVGMGGRLDSTNIIRPEVSIITNIGLEHTQFLGDTLEKIATEKAGIVKPSTPVVFGQVVYATKGVFLDAARRNHAPFTFAEEAWNCVSQHQNDNGTQHFLLTRHQQEETIGIDCDLLGYYQRYNVVTVLATVDVLMKAGYHITPKNVLEGIAHTQQLTRLFGRWQKLADSPLVMCDTAHNAEGIKEVMPSLLALPAKKLRCVIGLVKDKDLTRILPLFPKEAIYYFTQAAVPRALPATTLRDKALDYGLKGNTFSSVSQAVEAARAEAEPEDAIYIGGSTFTVGEALPLFGCCPAGD